MMPTSLSDEEEPFIYTTTHNTLVIIEHGSVHLLGPRTGEITLSLNDFEEILSALAKSRQAGK